MYSFLKAQSPTSLFKICYFSKCFRNYKNSYPNQHFSKWNAAAVWLETRLTSKRGYSKLSYVILALDTSRTELHLTPVKCVIILSESSKMHK